jgi:uncharacterized glyoxalase superfamily protein PhnB
MTKADPIIAVKDVEASAKWYCDLFGFKRAHGGKEFAVLLSESDEIILCLHEWGAHGHPTMTDTAITPGNGLILYLRTEKMNQIYQNAEKLGVPVEEETHLNSNSGKKEFSVRDPDGYFLTVSEFHSYEG